MLPKNSLLLRIYLGEGEKTDHHLLYQAIVIKARAMGMAGATVLRGPLGFGRSHHIHTAKILDLSGDLPVVIELIDTKEKIQAFLNEIEPMVTSTLVTVEKVQVLQYGTTRHPHDD